MTTEWTQHCFRPQFGHSIIRPLSKLADSSSFITHSYLMCELFERQAKALIILSRLVSQYSIRLKNRRQVRNMCATRDWKAQKWTQNSADVPRIRRKSAEFGGCSQNSAEFGGVRRNSELVLMRVFLPNRRLAHYIVVYSSIRTNA